MIKVYEFEVKYQEGESKYNVEINNVRATSGGAPRLDSKHSADSTIVVFNQDGSIPDLSVQEASLNNHLDVIKNEITENDVNTLLIDQLCTISYVDDTTALVTLASSCTNGMGIAALLNVDETLEDGSVRRMGSSILTSQNQAADFSCGE